MQQCRKKEKKGDSRFFRQKNIAIRARKLLVINTSFILQSFATIHLWKFSHSAAMYVIKIKKTFMHDMTLYLIGNFVVQLFVFPDGRFSFSINSLYEWMYRILIAHIVIPRNSFDIQLKKKKKLIAHGRRELLS